MCTKNIKILKTWLIYIEKTNDGIESFQAAVTFCLHVELNNAAEYLDIYYIQSDYYRRMLSKIKADPECSVYSLLNIVTELRGAFDLTEKFLGTYFPNWDAEWVRFMRYRASIEDEVVAEIGEQLALDQGSSTSSEQAQVQNVGLPNIQSQAQEIWERLVVRFGTKHQVWLEYIKWLRNSSEFELCRKLFKKAFKKVQEGGLELAYEYMSFERSTGSIETFLEADSRLQSMLEKITDTQVSSNQNKQETVKYHKEEFSNNKRSLETISSSQPEITLSQHDISSSNNGQSSKRMRQESNPDNLNNTRTQPSEPATSGENNNRAYRRSLLKAQKGSDYPDSTDMKIDDRRIEKIAKDDASSSQVKEDGIVISSHNSISEPYTNSNIAPIQSNSDNNNNISSSAKTKGVYMNTPDQSTIHIKNISFEVTEENLRSLFATCGSIRSISMVVAKSGKSRGMATIDFFSPSSAASAITKFNNFEFMGRNIIVQGVFNIFNLLSLLHPFFFLLCGVYN